MHWTSVLSTLTDIPNFSASKDILHISLSSVSLVSPRPAISSANLKLLIKYPPITAPTSPSRRAWLIIASKKMLKRSGDRIQPCFTPTMVSNHSDSPPLLLTALYVPSYMFSRIFTNFSANPRFCITLHSLLLHILSKAFLNQYNLQIGPCSSPYTFPLLVS